MDTEKLVVKARSGDDNAFYALIQARKDGLYRTAFSYVKNKDDALDIVSETVYKAYRSIKKLKDPALFNTWLTRILINSCLDYKKKNDKVVPAAELADGITASAAANLDSLDLHQAVAMLDEKCRTVVILKYFQDLTITQIADVMQCPQGTVKTYLHRALKTLRVHLKEDWQNA